MVINKALFQKQLFKMGWRVFGLNEDDPYFKVFLDGRVFGINDLSGNFTKNGCFEIYSIRDRVFSDINEIKEIFKVNRFNVNFDIMSRYGEETIIESN